MTCSKCEGAGFTIYVSRRDGGDKEVVQQCCDIAKYSKEIKRRYMGDIPPAEPVVLPFKQKGTV